MKRQNISNFAMLIFVLFISSHSLSAGSSKSGERKTLVFHDSVGEVIDAQENSRYNVFGRIPGFAAARVYSHETINGIFYRAQRDTLIIQTPGDLRLPVPDALIAEVANLRGEIRGGQFYRTDPNGSRLLLAPTARALKPGQGYFADYYLFFPTVAFGLHDNFSIGGGVSILPGAESQLVYIAPKLTVSVSPQFGLATGLLHLVIPDNTDDVTLGYAVGTVGNDFNGLTFGAALPLNSDLDRNPILLIGGEVQISNGAKLLTENWIFTWDETTILFSGGIRFFSERLAVDLALVGSEAFFGGDGFPFLPWVDFSVSFGK